MRINESDIWRLDLSRGTLTPLTHDAMAMSSVWTLDGKGIVFASATGGSRSSNLFRQAVDGSGVAEQLTTTTEEGHNPSSWTPDGRELAFVSGGDIWVLPLSGDDRHPRPVIQTAFREDCPAFSPDGRWLAYTSDESGQREVYVQPYPGSGAKTQVSIDGGFAPAWRGDGRELFFQSGVTGTEAGGIPILQMMAVDITTDPVFAAGMPRVLFEGNYEIAGGNRQYDVTPDGQRFLTTRAIELPMQPVTQIHVVLNWFEELKRLVPTN
jgi:Tol biopolymer transport system component